MCILVYGNVVPESQWIAESVNLKVSGVLHSANASIGYCNASCVAPWDYDFYSRFGWGGAITKHFVVWGGGGSF